MTMMLATKFVVARDHMSLVSPVSDCANLHDQLQSIQLKSRRFLQSRKEIFAPDIL